MFKKLVFAVAAVLSCVYADINPVVVLEQNNFEEYINGDKPVMVKFYAPWCGHCKSLAPEYEKAAALLKDKVVLAKVDATKEQALGQRFEIRGYPTLKFFSKGVSIDYNGGRTSADLVDWVEKRLGDAVKVCSSEQELNELLTKSGAADKAFGSTFIAYSKDASSPLMTAFKTFADAHRDFQTYFALVSSSVSEEKIVAKRAKEADAVLSATKDASKVTSFIETESFPLFGPINGDNFGHYSDRDLDMIWVCSDDKDEETIAPIIRQVASKVRNEYSVVWLDTNKYGNHATESLNVSEFPAIVVQKKDGRYIYGKKEMAEKPILTFLTDISKGLVEKSIKSEPVPESNDKPVKDIVGYTFDEMIFNTDKYVLFEVYAPWCGHCKRLTPIYEELAEKHLHNNKIVITKMNGTSNETSHPDFQWSGFPTIYFISGNIGDRKVQRYNGGRELDAFTSFLKTQMKSDYVDATTVTAGDVDKKDEL